MWVCLPAFFPFDPASLVCTERKKQIRKDLDEITAVTERSNFNTKKLQTILNKCFVFVIDDLLRLVSRHLGIPRETMEESLSHHKTTDGGFKTMSSPVVKQDVQTPALF